MDPNLVNDSKSSQSPLGARTGSEVDQIRPDLRDMRSTGSMDQIHPDHLDPGKKISQCLIQPILPEQKPAKALAKTLFLPAKISLLAVL